jgi:hypothetical protein
VPRKHAQTQKKAPAKRQETAEREARIADLAEKLSSTTHYYSESSKSLVPIAWMPIPHAEHALAKLERQYGDEVHETPVAQALAYRISQAGDLTEVAPNAETRMMRGDAGKFTGAVKINRRKA